jgi:hypothetical protein
MQRVNSTQARRTRVTDMTIEEVNLASSFTRRRDFQDRRRTTDAFEWHEIPEIKIAQRSA